MNSSKLSPPFPTHACRNRCRARPINIYNFFYMFSGIVQHELYHAGQIALLKKLQAEHETLFVI